MISNAPPESQETASSSTEGTSQIYGTSTIEDFGKTQPRTNTTAADQVIGTTGATPLPQPLENLWAIPSQMTMPPLINGHPTTMELRPPSNNPESSVPSQASEAVGFVTPQQIFPPPVFVESIRNNVAVISSMISKSPLATPSQVFEHSTMITSSQAAVSSAIPKVSYLVTPSPTLASSQTTLPGQVNVPHMIPKPLLVTPSPVLEFPPMVTYNQIGISPMASEAPPPVVIPPKVLEPPRAIDLQGSTDRRQVSNPPQVIDEPRTVTSAYKRRDQTNVTTATQSRRNSIEGAPNIMLTLSRAGYELVIPSAQSDISTAPPSTVSSSPALSPDELIVPSSQRSLEEFLVIPMEVESGVSNTPPTDELVIPSSPQSLEGTPTVSEGANKTSGHFHFAPRVIPDYNIDRSDFPLWLLECGRLDFVLSVEAGDIWERLITTWLRQERRLGFGLDDKIVCGRFCRLLWNTLTILHRE